jgi:hypothetical protein
MNDDEVREEKLAGLTDEVRRAIESIKGPSTTSALANRQVGNVDLFESNILEKIKASRQMLDKLESVVAERANQVRDKISDFTEIANITINATESLSHTIDVMLSHELKPL